MIYACTGVQTRLMEITVNGDQHRFESEISLQQLLEHLGIGQGRIAIELNGEIVPKSSFPQRLLRGGDTMEIVQAIGGG